MPQGNAVKPEDFDLQTAVARTYWTLGPTEDPIDPRRDWLGEDLIQIEFTNGHVVDVGWYPSYSPAGCFRVFLVFNQEWEAPVRSADCGSLAELRQLFVEFLEAARTLPGRS